MEPNTKAHQLLNHIGNELKLLWWQMDAYQELFLVEPEKRQRLLQNTAPGFFAITQVSFAESILMRVFRLMDPTRSRDDENSSIQHLHDALNDGDAAQVAVRACIASIRSDWIAEEGPYTALQTIRNKLLAHNDFAERSALDANQLGINLSAAKFESAQSLAGRLWAMYRQCNQVLRATDVIEPTHATLVNRPAMLLKHLCASRYLDSVVDDEPGLAFRLQAVEAKEMGNDKMRPVFVPADAAMKCGTEGDQK